MQTILAELNIELQQLQAQLVDLRYDPELSDLRSARESYAKYLNKKGNLIHDISILEGVRSFLIEAINQADIEEQARKEAEERATKAQRIEELTASLKTLPIGAEQSLVLAELAELI